MAQDFGGAPVPRAVLDERLIIKKGLGWKKIMWKF